ncbi:hypothetical protein [Catellatospora sp. NPDC049609]|uniref:hypothetical protein n=1 Tax=Catellatospora sp. NPDC049609 TaxID=3155505 RepID=UPI003429A52F
MTAHGGGLADRAVEVIHDGGPEARPRWTSSSGLLVTDRLVLTAAHAVPPGGTVTVRRADKVELPAMVRLLGDVTTADLALLELAEPVGWLPRLGFATVRRGVARQVDGCRGVGYPQFRTAGRDGGTPVRDTAQLDGVIPTDEQRIADLLTLRVAGAPRPLPAQQEALGASAWSGVSGTVVVTAYQGSDVVVGVVTEHQPRAGDAALTLTPVHHIDRLPDAAAWWALLGTAPDLLPALPDERPRPAYAATLAEVAARTPALLERAAELAELAAFAAGEPDRGGQGCRWLVAPPWAGKTALVAHLAVRPPAGVDVVAYLMQRRALDASGARFLTAVTGQLAYLLDEPAPAVADAAALAQLWRRAAERAARLDRRLLLVVDGLDEDLRPRGERSVASLLPAAVPGRAHVLVTSRHTWEPPDDLDPDHPLWTVPPRPIGQAVPAARVEQRAAQELRGLLDDAPARRLLGLLAAAGGPLRVAELAALDGADPFEVEAALRDRAGRVLDGTGGAWRFAHQTLLDECRDTVFGPERLAPYAAAVDGWADAWRDRSWPVDTPRHLLEFHPWALLARGATDRLSGLVTDPRWLTAALAATGVDAVLALLRSVPQAAVRPLLRLVEVEAHRLRAGDGVAVAAQLCLAAAHAGEPPDRLARWQEAVRRDGAGLVPLSATRRAGAALLRSLDPRAGQVWTVRFLDDATVLTGDGEGRLLVWDLADGTSQQLGAHDAAVHGAAVAPDGRTVLSCGNDRMVRLHHRDGTAPGRLPERLSRNFGQIWAVAYAPDGRSFAAAGRDRQVRVWDTVGLGERIVGEHPDQVRALAYTPDGRFLVSGGRDAAVRVWALDGGTGSFLGGHDGWVETVAVTPDGAYAVAGSYDGVVRLWPLDGGPFRDLGHHDAQVWTVAVSPDGAWAVSGAGDGRVLAWPLAPGRPALPRELGVHDAPVRCVAVSPDGRHVISSAAEGPVRLWDLAGTDVPPTDEPSPAGPAAARAFSGERPVVSGPDGFSWPPDEPSPASGAAAAQTAPGAGRVADGGSAPGEAPITALAVSPDGHRVYAGHHDGTVVCLENGGVSVLGGHGTPVRALAVVGADVVAAGDDGVLRVWGARPAVLGTHGSPVRALAYGGDVLVCAGTEASVTRWPGLRRSGGVDVGREVMALARDTDGTLVTGHVSGTVRRIGPDEQVTRLRGGGAQVWAVDVRDGLAVTGDRSGQVLLWRLADGTCRPLGAHRGAVSGVAFAGAGLVASAGEDGVRVWDAARAEPVAYVATGPVTALAAGGGTVATASRELGLVRWQVRPRR